MSWRRNTEKMTSSQGDLTIKTAALPTGITLEYLLTGPREAPVLAFVHGLGPNLRQFLPQVAPFAGPGS